MIIAPSVLTADLSNLAVACKEAVDAGLDWLHLDVMDGNFVPNLTFGPPVIKSLRKALGDGPVFDAHLMVSNAEECYMDYIEAGCNHLSVHIEAATHLHRLVTAIRDAGASVGVVINPATPIGGIAGRKRLPQFSQHPFGLFPLRALKSCRADQAQPDAGAAAP